MSPPLGGRDTVLNTPFNELLAHLMSYLKNKENDAYKEQIDFYMNFMALLHSNPNSEKAQKNTEKFMEQITPIVSKNSNRTESKGGYKWSERVQKKIEAKSKK